MKFTLKLAVVAAVVIVCFVLYSPLGIFYIVGGIVYLVASSYFPGRDDRKQEPLSPSKQTGSYVSSVWLVARMDEEEARRKEAEKEPTDQDH
jgi:hypothetical protein